MTDTTEPAAGRTAVAPWEARFRAPRTLWVRMATRHPERAIACSNVSGVYQIHRWRVGEAIGEPMSSFPTGKALAWISPDGEWVVWHADHAGDEVGHFVAVPWAGGDAIDLTPDLPDYASFAAGFGADGTFGCSIIGHDCVQLARVAFPPGSAPPALLDPGVGFVMGMAVAPDGALAYATTAGRGLQTVLRVIDGSTGETLLELDHAPGAIRAHHYSSTGRLVASTTRSGSVRPFVLEPDGSVRDYALPDQPGELTPISVSEDGRTILLVGAHRTVERLVLLDADSGETRTLEGITGDLNSWDGAGTFLRGDGTIVVTREDGTMLPEVLLVDAADGRIIETLIPTTPVPPSRRFRSLDVPTTDGATAQGWLVTPDGPGPFPTILDIHGGPQGHELDRFFPDAQAWVDRGFAFFTLNYRGSTGFGREYEQAIWGKVGRCELDDMVAAREALIRAGIADSHRVVLHGGSYGGYLTLLGLGRRPELWAAGVALVAIADWRLLYEDGESLRDYQVALFGGTPDETPDLHVEASPVTYVDRLRAPLLIIQGRNDARCPARQMEDYVGRATSLGKDVSIDWFDAGHGHGATDTRVAWCRRSIEFVETKLGIEGALLNDVSGKHI
jgi:dipeptidyl aminopeptidase/acylaminoacyl peptidase